MTGFGCIFGPLVGSTLYSLFGFADTFYAAGGFMLAFAILVRLKFPTSGKEIKPDALLKESPEENDVESLNTLKPVTIKELLLRARFTLAALSSALCYFVYSFQEPILAPRLNELHLNSMQIGWFFAILPIFYIPSTILVQYLPKQFEKRIPIFVAAVGLFIAFLFAGPSQFLSFPESIMLMGIG